MPGKGRLLISYLCPGTIHARTTWPADWQARMPDLRQGSTLPTTEIWTKTLDEARDAKCHKETIKSKHPGSDQGATNTGLRTPSLTASELA
jgi:hypothetical protein